MTNTRMISPKRTLPSAPAGHTPRGDHQRSVIHLGEGSIFCIIKGAPYFSHEKKDSTLMSCPEGGGGAGWLHDNERHAQSKCLN